MQRLIVAFRTWCSTAIDLARQIAIAFSGRDAAQLFEQSGHGPIYQPLTAQMGDKTYSGEWSFDGVTINVRCVDGTRAVAFEGQKPMPAAERLLIEIIRERGKL